MMSALSFLTIFGRGTPMYPTAYRWFPVVGLALGGTLGALWWGAGEVWHPILAAILTVVADAALTGALHYDGLADSADGLLPHLEPHRRLEIMRSPEIGAYAVVATALVLLVRVGAIASTPIEWWMFRRRHESHDRRRDPRRRPAGAIRQHRRDVRHRILRTTAVVARTLDRDRHHDGSGARNPRGHGGGCRVRTRRRGGPPSSWWVDG
jgi:Cobalamin-5-phosphate synthase